MSFVRLTAVVHILFLLSGWLIGWGLDELVWFLSHDYVFPPNLFVRNGLLTTWLAASVVVCALSWLGRVPVGISIVLRSATLSLLVSLLFFGAALAIVFAMTTVGWHLPGVTAAGPRRHQVSAAVPCAGFSAAALGSITFFYLLCRRRIEQ